MRTVDELAEAVEQQAGRFVLHVSPQEHHAILEHRMDLNRHSDVWTVEMRNALSKRRAEWDWHEPHIPEIEVSIDFVGAK